MSVLENHALTTHYYNKEVSISYVTEYKTEQIDSSEESLVKIDSLTSFLIVNLTNCLYTYLLSTEKPQYGNRLSTRVKL